MKRHVVKIVAAVLVMAGLVWLLARGTNWSEVAAQFGKANWGWMFVMLLAVIASMYLRIVRWSYIVREVKPVGFLPLFNATQIAFLINFTIGMRLGEPARALVLSRLSKLSFAQSLALAALDRVADLVGLIVVMVVAAAAFRPEGPLSVPANTVGNPEAIPVPANAVQVALSGAAFVMVGLVAVLVLAYINQRLVTRLIDATAGRFFPKLAAHLSRQFEMFAEGLHVFRNAKDMTLAVAFSLLTWTTFLISFESTVRAFGIEAPWYTVFVVQVFVAFALSAPGVPGVMGQFHLPIIAGLVFCVQGLEPERAKAVAIAAHAVNMAVILVLGFIALYLSGLSFATMTRGGMEIQDAEAGGEAPALNPHERDAE